MAAARPWAVALTAAMSIESPLLHEASGHSDTGNRIVQAQRALTHADGEPLTALAALAGYEAAPNKQQYCRSVSRCSMKH